MKFKGEIGKAFIVCEQLAPDKERRLTRVLAIAGLDVGAIAFTSLFVFGSGWTLAIWLLVFIFGKTVTIWLRSSGRKVFQMPCHRQYLFVVGNADKIFKVKKSILTIISYFIFTASFGQNKLDGIYVGLEEMCFTDSTGIKDCYSDPANSKWKWYHLSFLKLKGDSVFLDQDPIAIHKKDTTFSASDGAFYYYTGTLNIKDSIAIINLKLNFCDYCGMPKQENPNPFFPWNKNYYCRITKQGLFINGYLFKKSNDNDRLISEGLKPPN